MLELVGLLPKFFVQLEPSFHLFLVSDWLMCCSSRFFIVKAEALGVLGRWLVSHFPKANLRRNPPVLVRVYDAIAALPAFLVNLGLLTLTLTAVFLSLVSRQ